MNASKNRKIFYIFLILMFLFFTGQYCYAESDIGILVVDNRNDSRISKLSNELISIIKKIRSANSGIVDHRSLRISIYHWENKKHRRFLKKYFKLNNSMLPFVAVAKFKKHYPVSFKLKLVKVLAPLKVAKTIMKKCGQLMGKQINTDLPTTLSINSIPSGAEVFINHESKGMTPLELTDIGPGEYEIEIKKDNYSSHRETIILKWGDEKVVNSPLESYWGKLSISSSPSGAKIYIDGEEKGVTPLSLGKIRSGMHRIKISRKDCMPWEDKVLIRGDRITPLRATLERLSVNTLLKIKTKNYRYHTSSGSGTVRINMNELGSHISNKLKESGIVNLVYDNRSAKIGIYYKAEALNGYVRGYVKVYDSKRTLYENQKTVPMPTFLGYRSSSAAYERARDIFGDFYLDVIKAVKNYAIENHVPSATHSHKYRRSEKDYSYRSNPTSQSTTYSKKAFNKALLDGNLKEVEVILKANSGFVNLVYSNGNVPLHVASSRGFRGIVYLLLKYGADVNKRGKDGWTPLHWTAEKGHLSTAKLLVSNRANVNAGRYDGYTPLHIAAYWGRKSFVKYLLSKGANKHVRNRQGRTPAVVARNRGHRSLANYIDRQRGR